MGNPKAFLTINRKEAGYRAVNERIFDFGEVEQTLNPEDRRLQASRCMDCGVPFCHWGCPLGNRIPEWQDLVYKGKWEEAYRSLESTNDFPEFTGRICPAPCETSCVLKLSNQPVTIRENEASIVERAFNEGYILPHVPQVRTGKKVAVIGSGPAGLTVANRLNRKGHSVTVFEKNESIGGLLRLGIPDFKLNKGVIDRRLRIFEQEGIEFRTSILVGKDIATEDLLQQYDAICLAIGAEHPRDLNVEGRDLNGIHFALDFLQQQNRIVAGQRFSEEEIISAKGKHVLVIGGGDTGSDCVGTSVRQKAEKITQIEIMSKPPIDYNADTPWPLYPTVLKISSSHLEGCERRWGLETKRFIGKQGQVTGVEVEFVEWTQNENNQLIMQRTGKCEVIKANLILLAMGFVHPVQDGLLRDLNVTTDNRKNIAVNKHNQSTINKVFAAGDSHLGASLVVKAIASGRNAAKAIDVYLKYGN